jgi:hypothetical protein
MLRDPATTPRDNVVADTRAALSVDGAVVPLSIELPAAETVGAGALAALAKALVKVRLAVEG